ncbi:electron transfer flavoprotein beta subunit/FixA family protein [Rhizobium sp. 2YAF20]|uniref:electron transfer flavoprotein subunit beta/FixA family protein n=1 Tax=Rhizobium sp. 2YAF20 TaxID=3233027 RepID=UPI003F976098
MEIVVLIKKVPDPNLPEHLVSISDSQEEIVLHASAQYSINLYDLNAAEAAIALKETSGGTVTVVTADDASADQYLRRVLAMGADRAIRVELSPAFRRDSFQTARAIVTAIKQSTNPSVVIAGRQSSDTDAGYVPFLVAYGLGASVISPVVSISKVGENAITVGKLADASVDEYELKFPAMVIVSNEINKPRTPGLKGVMAAKKAAIEVVLAVEQGVSSIKPKFAPKKGQRAVQATQFVEGSDDDKAAVLLAALGK